MKVGIITAWFERGAANVSRNYMEGLQKLGHEVFVFARGGEEYSSHFDAIACPTELMLDIFKETGIAHLVRWGVDTNVFKPLGLNLTNDQCVFFHSAGMSFGNLRKGSDVLIKAWGRLTKRERS